VRRPVLALAALAVALLLAVPAWAAGPTVGVRDASFGRGKLTIAKNTTVTFRWRGSRLHNVRSERAPRDARKFNSITRRGGSAVHRAPFSFRHRFTVKGSYRLICDVHGYTMRVVVR
jgi:plastocyanin